MTITMRRVLASIVGAVTAVQAKSFQAEGIPYRMGLAGNHLIQRKRPTASFLSFCTSTTADRGRFLIRDASTEQRTSATKCDRNWIRSPTSVSSSSGSVDPVEPSVAQVILNDIHSKEYRHRIVVVGNGAILESIQILGPRSVLGTSPATGERLQTFSSEDGSFEFHLKVDRIAGISFLEKERPDGTTMRITRIKDGDGGSMCSLILAEYSEEAVEWFGSLVALYGQDVEC